MPAITATTPPPFYPEPGQPMPWEEMKIGDVSKKKLPGISATIARSQWKDYLRRYVPFEESLFQQTYYDNPKLVQGTLNTELPRVRSAINLGQQIQSRRLRALGQYVSREAQTRLDRTWDSERALATVDAANRIRQNIADRSRDIAFGGTGSTTGRTTATAPYSEERPRGG